jgi:hypothetical protein
LVFAGVAVFGLAACDVLLGLGNYSDGPGDASQDAQAEAQVEAGIDGGVDASVDAHRDAGADADADADAAVGENEAGIDGPTLLQRWAQWPMPNPDASIGGDSSVLLPNTMSYDAGDGGSVSVLDEVTGLVWRSDFSATPLSYSSAAEYCAQLKMRLPTRIELVSLIDFTQTPTIALTMFPGTQRSGYWTSSTYPTDGAAERWYVDFTDGTVKHSSGAQTNYYARCVSEGAP